jgi:hypothetical protein
MIVGKSEVAAANENPVAMQMDQLTRAFGSR